MPSAILRDYIPEGFEMSDAEKQRSQFSRNVGSPQPQATGIKAVPLGSASAQVEEAMRLAKERNAAEQAAEQDSFEAKVALISGKSVNEAVPFLQDLSVFEQEAYLRAEIAGKNRATLKAHFGWN